MTNFVQTQDIKIFSWNIYNADQSKMATADMDDAAKNGFSFADMKQTSHGNAVICTIVLTRNHWVEKQ